MQPARSWLVGLLCAGLALFQTAPAAAGAAETARRAAEQLHAATEALAEASGARDRVAALTRTIGAYEEGLAALRDGLRQVAIREAAIRRQFDARSAELARLLGVLATLERSKGPLMLLHPAGPLGTVRSGMMLAEVAPSLAAEAEAIRADLEELATMRALQESVALTLETGLLRVQEARVELSQAIADRRELPIRLTDDPDAMRALADGAETLDAFAAGLASSLLPSGDAGRTDFAAARGQLPLPVQGTVLRRPGEADAAGVRRPGLVLATRPRALVTAPSAATIRYVGPLLDYANVMVLEPAEDYLMVIAGLDIVYGAVGEVVPEGAALGLMGGDEPHTMEFLASARQGGGERSETLYLELRQGTEPVNPSEWFTQTRE